MGYYDRILDSMLVALVAGTMVGFHPVVQLHYGLESGALVATLFLWDGIFRNPPIPPSTRGSRLPQQSGMGYCWCLCSQRGNTRNAP